MKSLVVLAVICAFLAASGTASAVQLTVSKSLSGCSPGTQAGVVKCTYEIAIGTDGGAYYGDVQIAEVLNAPVVSVKSSEPLFEPRPTATGEICELEETPNNAATKAEIGHLGMGNVATLSTWYCSTFNSGATPPLDEKITASDANPYSFTYTIEADVSALGATPLRNCVYIDWSASDIADPIDSPFSCVDLEPLTGRDIRLEATGGGVVEQGAMGSVILSVFNSGTSSVGKTDGISLEYVKPGNFSLKSYGWPGANIWNCKSYYAKLTCQYIGPDIAPGDAFAAISISLIGGAAPSQIGAVTHCATVKMSSGPDDDPSNDTGCVGGEVKAPKAGYDLAITKKIQPIDPKVPINESYFYDIVVTNIGTAPIKAPFTVRVTDQLPPDMTLLMAWGLFWQCVQNPHDFACDVPLLLPIAPGASLPVLKVHGKVAPGATGDLTNCAVVSGTNPDANPGNDKSCDTTPVR